MFKEIKKLHKFFVEKTPEYIGTDVEYDYYWYGLPFNSGYFKLTNKQKFYYPIAYLKFMYFGVKDFLRKASLLQVKKQTK